MSLAAPALFVGHGSPMNAIENTPSAQFWRELAGRFPRPRAVLCVSAHWVSQGVRVTASPRPRTIHDFGRGFPQALFEVQYPAPGDRALAQDLASRLGGFGAQLDEDRGLDHGAWSVLRRMYPEADVPVVQLSLDARRGPAEHFALGQALCPLRAQNVLLLAAGNIVHNLPAFFGAGEIEPWVERFDRFVTDAAIRAEPASVLEYRAHPDAAQAAPDWDHFYPVFYTLAARTEGDKASVHNTHYQPGLSMTAFAYGLPQ